MATILIVDDHATNRQFIVTLLGYYGHRMLEASNGAEALELMRKEHPDLVITDIVMPIYDGHEFALRIRANSSISKTPIIFYSATYQEREARAIASTCGVSHVIFKPAEPKVILDTVSEVLGVKSPSAIPSVSEEVYKEQVPLYTGQLYEKASELKAANLRLADLFKLCQKMFFERDPLRLLENFCYPARRIVGAKYAAIGVLDKEGKSFQHFFTSGIDPEIVAHIGSPPSLKGFLGKLHQNVPSLRISNISRAPGGVGFPPHHPQMGSFLGAQIASSDRVYGSFYFADKIGLGEFTDEDEQVAIVLASQLAIAYENATLNVELQCRNAELEEKLAERNRMKGI